MLKTIKDKETKPMSWKQYNLALQKMMVYCDGKSKYSVVEFEPKWTDKKFELAIDWTTLFFVTSNEWVITSLLDAKWIKLVANTDEYGVKNGKSSGQK